MDLILDPDNPLHDIYGAYSHALPKLFCNYKYEYASSMIKVYFSPAVNPEGGIYKCAVHNIYGKKLLKQRYFIIILNRRK